MAKNALLAEQARRFEYETFCAEFIEEYAKRNQPASWDLSQRALLDLGTHLKKQVGKVRVDTLERDQIEKALAAIAGRSGSASIAARKAIRKMYTWANDKTILSWHPARSLDTPAKANIRDRVLSGAELKAVYEGAQALGYPFGDLYTLILFTGLRLREAAEAVWGEYQSAHEALVLQPNRMKRKPSDERGAFLMPLNIGALLTIEKMKDDLVEEGQMPPADRPIFRGSRKKAVSGFSAAKIELDDLIEQQLGHRLPHWTTHDLRRTMSTVLQPLGVAQKIIDRLQDHRDKEISRTARHYQHYDYIDEKRDAVRLYYRYLCGVIFGEEQFKDLVLKVRHRLEITTYD